MNIVRHENLYEASLAIVEGDLAVSSDINALVILPASNTPVDSWRYVYVKRAFDLLLSLMFLAVLVVPGCVIAALIVLTSYGPVFYREKRVGRYGNNFQIWKFRSMHCNTTQIGKASSSHSNGNLLQFRMRKHLHDPRITWVGRVLRRWSLDELPQFINVLRGEMSIVGPRPIIAAETQMYEHRLSYYLAATPGLSGMWQVSGRSNVDYPQRAELDAIYVQKWSLLTDLWILLKTIPAVLNRTGAR
jgi:undecaprenyl-phosphate galactose phosphotransferase